MSRKEYRVAVFNIIIGFENFVNGALLAEEVSNVLLTWNDDLNDIVEGLLLQLSGEYVRQTGDERVAWTYEEAKELLKSEE